VPRHTGNQGLTIRGAGIDMMFALVLESGKRWAFLGHEPRGHRGPWRGSPCYRICYRTPCIRPTPDGMNGRELPPCTAPEQGKRD